MTNVQVLVFYSPLVFLCLFVVADTLRNKAKRMTGNVLFAALMLLGWLLAEMSYYAFLGPVITPFLNGLNLPFVAFASMAILLLTIRLYNLEAYYTRATTLLLGILPLFTTVLCLTNPLHHLVRQEVDIVAYTPTIIVDGARGPWFWVHAVYCYIVLLAALAIPLAKYHSLPKIYLRSTQLLLVGLSVSIVGNVITLLKLVDLPLDFSLIGGSISGMFLMLSVRNNQGLDTLNRAKSELFNELDDSVWVLNDTGEVVMRNTAAKYQQFYAGVYTDEPLYANVRVGIFKDARHAAPTGQDWGGMDYTLADEEDRSLIYNLHENEIHDKRGRLLGRVVICSDVTENRKAIRRLEIGAGLDALTGLLNRHSIQKKAQEMDTPENLPLSMIIGDLNGLKKVNDGMGHQQGDVMLRVAAETLLAVSPPNAAVGRLGGDEFMLLLPRHDVAMTQRLVENLRDAFAAITDYPFQVSIALGFAGKTANRQSLTETQRKADEAMYLDKKQHKGAAG